MKKRLLVGLTVLLLLGGVAVCLEPTGVVLGWLHGEAFYHQRPARYWGKALTDADPKTQVEAHQQLKEGGRTAVPVLAQLLQGGDAEARWRAADLLGQLGAEGHEAVPALVQALRDDDPHVRSVAVKSLAGIGPAGSETIPVLQDMLDGGDRLQALQALRALWC